jgi:phage tail sheath protein FI
MVANWTQYTDQFGGYMPGAFLAHAVYGYFNNGGTLCFVVRVNEDAAPGSAPPAVGLLAARASGGPATLKATEKAGAAGTGDIRIEVADGPDDSFNVTVRRGDIEEKHEGLIMGRGPKNAVTTINRDSKLVTVEQVAVAGAAAADTLPAAGTYPLTAQAGSTAMVPVSPTAYSGDVGDRTGLGGLEAVDEVTMLCAPDVMAAYQAGALDMDGVKAIQLAMIAHCERMGDRVAIIDTPPGLNAQQVSDWRMNTAGYDSKYAAMYYPWIQVADPTPGAAKTTMFMPPSGHMAGIWARSDGERGVHKAPANEVIRGCLGLETNLTDSEQGVLNPNGVNCMRVFPGRGIRVWGARTLSSDGSWRYLNVRRLFNFVEKSIQRGTQWVVFEPNDMDLWERLKRDVDAYLKTVWASGALFGASSSQAFFVKCDAENNPPEQRDLGRLFVDIGIAPVKPAEFVIFRIGQYAPEA